MFKYFLGIDLHYSEAVWTLINSQGKMINQYPVDVNLEATKQAAKELPAQTQAALEPVGDFVNYSRILEQADIPVRIATPGKVKAIAWNKLKNDRVDSEILANLLRVQLLPSSSLRNDKDYAFREMVRLRNHLVRMRSKLKQKLTMLNNGLVKLTKQQLMQQTRLNRVKSTFDKEIKSLDNYLKKNYLNDRMIQIICSIPGCGLITALTIKAEIGDITRFNKPTQLCAWAGLVPTSKDSGGKMKRGHITHQGSKWLRYALYESAVNVREKNGNELYAFYQRIANKGNKKKARTALARKILALIWYLVNKDELYRKQKSA